MCSDVWFWASLIIVNVWVAADNATMAAVWLVFTFIALVAVVADAKRAKRG